MQAPSFSNAERVCLTLFFIVFVVAVLGLLYGVYIPQHPDYHAFADRRSLLGLPFAGDVLSNLPFAFIGLYGLVSLAKARVRSFSAIQFGLLTLSFWGLILTAAGSTFYHWAPDNYGLTIDRLGMTCAFAGILSLAIATRITDRTGVIFAIAILVLAPFAIVYWQQTGNLWLWSVLQGGGMLVLLALAFRKPSANSVVIQLGWVVAWYVIAKLLELNDHQVFEWTQQIVSGHTLKHLAAALAAWPLASAIRNAFSAGDVFEKRHSALC